MLMITLSNASSTFVFELEKCQPDHWVQTLAVEMGNILASIQIYLCLVLIGHLLLQSCLVNVDWTIIRIGNETNRF